MEQILKLKKMQFFWGQNEVVLYFMVATHFNKDKTEATKGSKSK